MKEKRLATILYADLTGFTILTAELGPERITEVVNECFRTIDSIIHVFDGTVIRHEGDRVMAVFGFPKSHGNDSYCALLSALKIRDAIKALNHPIETHIGIAAGEIIADDERIYGYVTETASGLEEKAPAGEIFIDKNCFDVNENLFEFQIVPKQPVPTYRLIAEKSATMQYEYAFVNRRKEMDQLTEHLTSCRQAIIVVGEQGVGKTRFVHETVHRHSQKAAFHFIQTSFLTTRTLQFYEPILKVIHMLNPDYKLKNGTDMVTEASYRSKLYNDFCNVIFSACGSRQLVILFQYFDRADKDSIEFFKYLINNLGDRRITLIFEMQRKYKSFISDLQSVAKDRPAVVQIDVLTNEDQHKLLEQLCDDVTLPAAIMNEISQRAGGNPLFLMEICYFMRRQCSAGKMPARIKIPYRIKEVMNHLIDQIPLGIFNTLAIGALCGYSVKKNILMDTAPNANETVRYATENGFCTLNDGELTFTNPFFRDEIRNRIPKSVQQNIHRKIASVLRERPADHETSKTLAYHFKECGDFELALHYALRWAKKLKDMHANESALEAYGDALEISKKLENKAKYRILLERCEILHLLGKKEEEKRDIEQLEQIVEEHGSEEMHLDVILRRGLYLTSTSDFKGAIDLYENYCKKHRNMRVLERLAMAYYNRNKFQKAIAILNEAIQMARTRKDLKQEAALRGHFGLVFMKMGDKEKALDYTREAIRLFYELDEMVSAARFGANLGTIYYYQNRYPEALEAYQEALKVATEIGDVNFHTKMLINSGSIYTIMGDYEKALRLYQQALVTARSNLNKKWEAIVLNNIGNIYATVGRHQEALGYFEDAFHLNEEIGDISGIAVRYGNIGDSYAHLGRPDKALENIRKAHDLSIELDIIDWISFYKNELALALLLNKEIDLAFSMAEESLKLARKAKSKSYEINALSTLGMVCLAMQEHKKAHRYSKNAVQELDKMGTIEGTACNIYFNHYKIATALGKHEEARRYLQKSYADVKERGGRIVDDGMQRSFYDENKENREIIEAWETLSKQK